MPLIKRKELLLKKLSKNSAFEFTQEESDRISIEIDSTMEEFDLVFRERLNNSKLDASRIFLTF